MSTDSKLPSENIEENDSTEFDLKSLEEISLENLKQTKEFLRHRYAWAFSEEDAEGWVADPMSSNIHPDQLQEIVKFPESKLLLPPKVVVNEMECRQLFTEKFVAKKEQLHELIQHLEDKKKEVLSKNIFLSRKKGSNVKGRYENFAIMDSITDGLFEEKIRRANIRCALLLSDTVYTRNMSFYKKIVDILIKNAVPFVEYTNVQPDLDRKLAFRISEFANDHDVNAMIVVGSMSTIDVSKIVLPKLVKPHILRLHKFSPKESIAPNYTVFTIPTLIVPDPKINSRSALKHNVLLPKFDYFGDTIFLDNLVDDSDFIFYCTDIFDELGIEKMWEILHETYFRLILNWFDLSSSPELSDSIIQNLKTVDWYLNYMKDGNELNNYDRTKILEIVASLMDGRNLLDVKDFWIWYRLEQSLSLLVNSKKSYGLALFLPAYLEMLAKNSMEFKSRAVELGNKLYGAYSVEGLIYNLVNHVKKFSLPIRFLDIPQIKRIDYKFLLFLIKKASSSPFSNKLTRTIIKNLTVW